MTAPDNENGAIGQLEHDVDLKELRHVACTPVALELTGRVYSLERVSSLHLFCLSAKDI